jgi:allantoin racemase
VQIRYVIPGPMSDTVGHAEVTRREELLRSWAAPDVDARVQDLPSGPASIESIYEEALAVPPLVDALPGLEADGVDAVIVGCFDDPGVDALRELAQRTLIIGPGAAAMHLASILGGTFGIVTVPNPTATRKLVLTERLAARLVDVGLVNIPVLGLRDDVEATFEAMSDAGQALVARGAETIVLGCMSMAFLDIEHELGARLGVPVINPAKTALGVAELLVRAGQMPSRVTFPPPPKLSQQAESFS